MLMETARNELIAFGKKMSSERLSNGTTGNLSIFDPSLGLMAITPSDIGYFETMPEDIVIMALDGTIVEGHRKPSSEYPFHAIFYRNKPEARAVVHTHSRFCTTFACMNLPLKALHYLIVEAGVFEIPCASYATFGTQELAESAIESCGESRAVLLANHGLIAYGASMPKAFSLASTMEFVAEIQWRAMCAGKPVVLSTDEMERVLERAKTYGQPEEQASN